MRVRKILPEDLKKIKDDSWVDTTRRPFFLNGKALVPVKDGEVFDQEIPERHVYQGRGFFMIGNIAVTHGKKPTSQEIKDIVDLRSPRGVLWIDSIRDLTRTPSIELLWGDAGETEHHENRYTYFLDPTRVMFSQGNREEKLRIANLTAGTNKSERIADMFAGIGYFTIPLAANGANVHAMEINPVAFGYLKKNITANSLEGRVTPCLGDCRTLLSGVYDRIVMGHFDAVDTLPEALAHAHKGTTLHIHSIDPIIDKIEKTLKETGFSAGIRVHKVKKYRPRTWHVVQDVTLS